MYGLDQDADVADHYEEERVGERLAEQPPRLYGDVRTEMLIFALLIYLDIFVKLHIPPTDALLFPGRLRPGKRSASIGRRL